MINIEVDRELCQGYANCIVAAPDVFDLDEDGRVMVLRGQVGGDSERGRLDESVRSCPVAALRLHESEPIGRPH